MKHVLMLIFTIVFLMSISTNGFSITRTLKTDPAIVIVAFGTTTSASSTFDFFDAQLKKDLPDDYKNLKIHWAFTSEIVRQRVNEKMEKQGKPDRMLSLPQVLANLMDSGYRKIAIQPLHIFPGQEYEDVIKVIDAFKTLGLDIHFGGTLLNEWTDVSIVLKSLEPDFLSIEQGCNILIAHGTPQTFTGSNDTYIGLDRFVSSKYKNVFIGTVSGILTRDQLMENIKTCKVKKIRMIPFMFVAGDHIMNDVMGDKPDKKGAISWKMELEQNGFIVESPKNDFKGLGYYKDINGIFIRQLLKALQGFN